MNVCLQRKGVRSDESPENKNNIIQPKKCNCRWSYYSISWL